MGKNNAIICLLAGMMLSVNSCSNDKSAEQVPVSVRLFTVENAETQYTQDFPGRIIAAEEVNLAFKVGGTLKNVYVEEGRKVTKGQIVAEIDPRDYQVQLDAAEAEYMSVKSEAERVIALYADSVGTAEAYDKARYGLRQITAKYENAKNQLADTRIYAPFDGSVQTRFFDPPTVIAAGMPVVTLVSGGRQEIEINIPASVYINRDRMTAFSASFEFIPNQQIPLRLISIAPKANANQLYAVRLALPQDVSPQLSPGMNALVSITIDDTGEGKAGIPSAALFKKGEESCVYVYDENDEVVRQRNVSVVRLHTDGTAIITQGLSDGERIVVGGVHKLTDCQKVKPMSDESETNVGDLL